MPLPLNCSLWLPPFSSPLFYLSTASVRSLPERVSLIHTPGPALVSKSSFLLSVFPGACNHHGVRTVPLQIRPSCYGPLTGLLWLVLSTLVSTSLKPLYFVLRKTLPQQSMPCTHGFKSPFWQINLTFPSSVAPCPMHICNAAPSVSCCTLLSPGPCSASAQ